MNIPKLMYGEFIAFEIKRFFSSIPQIVLLLGSIGSGWAMYRFQLSEVLRAILEGILAGYIFYLFVDVFPKAEKRAASAKKVAEELSRVLNMVSTLKIHVKEEVLANGQNPQNQEQFFSLLQSMIGTHLPTTNNMKRIKGTTPATATQQMQFHYSNLDEVLRGELIRLTQRLEGFERACAIYGLADLDMELMRIVGDLPTRPFASRGIQALRHINNTPAVFGTDFDLIEETLLKVKTAMESDWRMRFA